MTSQTIASNSGPQPEELRDLHRSMLRLRMVEMAIVERYSQGEMRCPTHLCVGQEATPAGVSAHLAATDMAFGGHRSHGHYLCKGGDLKAMLAEIYCRDTGCAGGRGGSQHLIDLDAGFVAAAPILACTIPIGVGAAWGAAMRGETRVSAVYFGDGATEEGTFHEAMNLAATERLPVLFVCENNFYSVHSALDVRQPAGRQLWEVAKAHGMPGVQVDGNDVEAVWQATAAAVDRARSGGGPTFLECLSYRWLEHCGPATDDALGYRSPEEVADWRDNQDPVERARRRLFELGLLDEARLAALEAELKAEIDDAFEFARASPFPAADELFDHVFPGASRA